jgi:5'-nucleotidase
VVKGGIKLVVSGINPHANIGHDVTYSGTVTAAMEAVISGIPGIAVSLDSPPEHTGPLDYGPAARAALRVARRAVEKGLPTGALLNVNVPYLQDAELKGYAITRQGLRVYRDALDARTDPRGVPYYWIGGDIPTGVPEDGTDVGALSAGYVSITPLQLDLTHQSALKVLAGWSWDE